MAMRKNLKVSISVLFVLSASGCAFDGVNNEASEKQACFGYPGGVFEEKRGVNDEWNSYIIDNPIVYATDYSARVNDFEADMCATAWLRPGGFPNLKYVGIDNRSCEVKIPPRSGPATGPFDYTASEPYRPAVFIKKGCDNRPTKLPDVRTDPDL
jgi:hypothetical protein